VKLSRVKPGTESVVVVLPQRHQHGLGILPADSDPSHCERLQTTIISLAARRTVEGDVPGKAGYCAALDTLFATDEFIEWAAHRPADDFDPLFWWTRF